MSVTLDLPAEMETRLRQDFPDLEGEAINALALDLFRRERITHHELGQILGLDRIETDTFLKQHDEYAQSMTMDDLESDYQSLKKIMSDPVR